MLFKDWLKKNNMRPYTAARAMGVDHAIIYKYLNHRLPVSKNVAVLVEEFTDGAVSRSEMLWPDDYEKEEKNGKVQKLMFPKIKKGRRKSVDDL